MYTSRLTQPGLHACVKTRMLHTQAILLLWGNVHTYTHTHKRTSHLKVSCEGRFPTRIPLKQVELAYHIPRCGTGEHYVLLHKDSSSTFQSPMDLPYNPVWSWHCVSVSVHACSCVSVWLAYLCVSLIREAEWISEMSLRHVIWSTTAGLTLKCERKQHI